jgi:hypothetical protein
MCGPPSESRGQRLARTSTNLFPNKGKLVISWGQYGSGPYRSCSNYLYPQSYRFGYAALTRNTGLTGVGSEVQFLRGRYLTTSRSDFELFMLGRPRNRYRGRRGHESRVIALKRLKERHDDPISSDTFFRFFRFFGVFGVSLFA